MKKFLISLIVSAIAAAGAYYAYAAKYNIDSFFSYSSTTPLGQTAYVGQVFAANTTYTNGQTNVTMYLYGNNYPQFVSASAAMYAYSTNTIGNQSSGTIGGTGYTNITAYGTNLGLLNPYAFALTGTNTYFVILTNGMSNTTSGAVTPTLFAGTAEWAADSLGQFNGNGALTFAADADDNGQKGAMTIKIAKSYDGLTFDTNNLQSITLNLNGTNIAMTNWVPPITSISTSGATGATNVTITNVLPTSWLTGARIFKIWSVTTPTNSTSGTNVYFFVAEASQFTP